MLKALLGAAAVCLLCSPAAADPTNLRLSFFSSDRSLPYQQTVRPFVDAVNAEGTGFVHIDVFFSGAISGDLQRQAQLVADGTADLALIVPGQTPERFHDGSVLELPGLFRNSVEGSRVFTRLVSEGLLSGYEDFYVVGATVSGPENVHTRARVASLAELKGLKIRVNNCVEAEALQDLDAVPVLLSINQTSEAVSKGSIDGAALPLSMLFEFGVGRVATYHEMIGLGGAPVAVVMNRKKFVALPSRAQAIIRRYSGQWLSGRAAAANDEADREVLQSLQNDPLRSVIFPNDADAKTIQAVYQNIIAKFAASSEHNRALLARVRAELAQLRSGE